MVNQDMFAVKDFLWKKNNAEELNIDKTCLVGLDMGASVAMDFVLYDAMGYEQQTAQYGPLKLGRFVKAIVLISPEMAFRGLDTKAAISSPELRSTMPVMILVGKKNPTRFADAERLYGIFSKGRPVPEDEALESQTVWYGRLDTSLQGIKLMDEASLNVPKRIGQFFYYRLVKNPDAKKFVWKERKLPHE
jgi:hypothetical protein